MPASGAAKRRTADKGPCRTSGRTHFFRCVSSGARPAPPLCISCPRSSPAPVRTPGAAASKKSGWPRRSRPVPLGVPLNTRARAHARPERRSQARGGGVRFMGAGHSGCRFAAGLRSRPCARGVPVRGSLPRSEILCTGRRAARSPVLYPQEKTVGASAPALHVHHHSSVVGAKTRPPPPSSLGGVRAPPRTPNPRRIGVRIRNPLGTPPATGKTKTPWPCGVRGVLG